MRRSDSALGLVVLLAVDGEETSILSACGLEHSEGHHVFLPLDPEVHHKAHEGGQRDEQREAKDDGKVTSSNKVVAARGMQARGKDCGLIHCVCLNMKEI